VDAATVTAGLTGFAAVIAAIGAVIKIVVSRPRLPVAEELLEQIDELRVDVLELARWAHRAIAQAAAQGVELEEPPAVLRSSGEREGERRHSPARHGWRSSVEAQTGESVIVDIRPDPSRGPSTIPDRRRPHLPQR
jgi:hypothetical protein